MCEIDLDPCSVWREHEVKARKAHGCDCCGGMVAAGKRYWRHFSLLDGYVTSEKLCSDCYAARAEFTAAHDQIPQPGNFAELLRECFLEESRQFWTEQDRRWRTLYAGMVRRGRAARRAPRC